MKTETAWDQLGEPAMNGNQAPVDFQMLQVEMVTGNWYFSGT